MTLVQYLLDAGPEGGNVTNANSGSTASSLTLSSTSTYAAAYKAHGSFGMKIDCKAGGQAFRRYPFAGAVGATNWAASFIITLPASAPGNTIVPLQASNASDAGRLYLRLLTNGNLELADVGSAHFGTIATGLTWGQKYRVSLMVAGGSSTAGAVTAKVYSGTTAWTTQLGSTFTASNWNLGADAVDRFNLGVTANSAAAVILGIDTIQLNDGSTTEIGDYSTPLDTPVVTLGAATDPTTIGGTDGTQTVSWPAVTDAASYEAYIAAGSTPAQGDFTLVASGVTSPYTFTGLAAGTHSYGIKAKA